MGREVYGLIFTIFTMSVFLSGWSLVYVWVTTGQGSNLRQLIQIKDENEEKWYFLVRNDIENY